ncbi:G-type lectin S-receptor-like serine/threonine-protein kinase SD2-5 [Dendrobium catenatum]|uniref:G-type lectin S-receptor-like serine/threonine-protein kinase SD2-5 n=1 Tax=Dendrobium catenatum TaxID=906689 RepID=A0A2I0W7V0_9ASPA|nr:G-type lectin S-receptor-like serine/threonine-protein kinase SD2-5 [Dendrobium catenatum]
MVAKRLRFFLLFILLFNFFINVIISLATILGVSRTGYNLFAVISASMSAIYICLRACKKTKRSEEQGDILNLPRLPNRFSFKDLKIATENFGHKLGQGGFGSVFEGKLADDTKVAVKRLEDGIIGQGRKEFLAEVETICNLHHINVVRLIGFCAKKSHRLLVFEFMENGSLEKWIFDRTPDTVLDWQTKVKIIIDIAKGLSYLHEECRQRIAHLDIKPQNILIDKNFNAKVADFGLAKLIDRDQHELNTRMRGTIGYLAPEWLTSTITKKVDVFSFGIVEKVKIDRLLDMVDRNEIDIRLHGENAVEMMTLAMWCLQTNSCKRPSMSTVVKVLEGNLSMETNLDYNFFTSATLNTDDDVCMAISSELNASHLSGPR